jgi:general secretion pathway protein J
VLVVGWTRRDVNGTPTWLRWQSAPVTTRGELEQAWQRADLWAQNPGDADRAREVAIAPLADWQLFYFRENAWTNPQSSDVTTGDSIAATGATGQLPDGVRLVIALPPGGTLAGVITRDWVRPQLGGGKELP